MAAKLRSAPPLCALIGRCRRGAGSPEQCEDNRERLLGERPAARRAESGGTDGGGSGRGSRPRPRPRPRPPPHRRQPKQRSAPGSATPSAVTQRPRRCADGLTAADTACSALKGTSVS
ncbi:hypothetical protein Q5P01_016906 [Channa striata]|uniref:Uncharacterized protein n=1 Tax=Channa striata TaxID=64152 RepID=A0AA88SGN8_CHASR|nr:hypothetical protein Q5P01_016906 [Channa striata]